MSICSLETGKYCYLGLYNMLHNNLSVHSTVNHKVLSIAFNIDGIPLYKSCNSQLWPILRQVKNFKSKPFPVRIFYGIFKRFCEELKHITKSGITLNVSCIKSKYLTSFLMLLHVLLLSA